MRTWLVVFGLVACGSQREVSKVKYTRTTCTDCGIDPSTGHGFAAPDAERGVPASTTSNEPPEPTCRLAAESLVSLELGNYAAPEERAPKVAAAERRCAAAKLSRDDRQCLVDSYDRESAVYCAPALFPGERVEMVPAEDCAAAAKVLRERFALQAQHYTPDQRVRLERQLAAVIESCRHDRWNAAMYDCITSNTPYFHGCRYIQPAVMFTRLQARIDKAATPAARTDGR